MYRLLRASVGSVVVCVCGTTAVASTRRSDTSGTRTASPSPSCLSVSVSSLLRRPTTLCCAYNRRIHTLRIYEVYVQLVRCALCLPLPTRTLSVVSTLVESSNVKVAPVSLDEDNLPCGQNYRWLIPCVQHVVWTADATYYIHTYLYMHAQDAMNTKQTCKHYPSSQK